MFGGVSVLQCSLSLTVQLEDLSLQHSKLLLQDEEQTRMFSLDAASADARVRKSDPQRVHQQLQASSFLLAAPAVLLQLLPQVCVSMLDVTELQQGTGEAPLQL